MKRDLHIDSVKGTLLILVILGLIAVARKFRPITFLASPLKR